MGATTITPWSPTYPPSLATPITSETLAAVRALTAWVLQRERAAQVGSATPLAPEAMRQQLEALPSATLLQAIQRHRLQSLLQADPAVGDLLPDLWGDLQRDARREAMAALALASLTREMAVLFAEASIPLLVIKGIPLALQTTGSLTARGRGDCDLLVDPAQVGAAIELLQSAGFVLSYGASCVGDDSLRGRYSRFVSIEISLQRDVGGQRQLIDLHWRAAHAPGLLQGFQQLWQRRESLNINHQPVATLSRCDALVHGCCHAASDRWMLLRNLVDLERLAQGLPDIQVLHCQRQRLVRKSFAVLVDCGFRFEPTSPFAFQANFARDSTVVRLARSTQLSVSRTDESLFSLGLRHLNMSHMPLNWLVQFLLMIAPPDVLICSFSGKPLTISQVFRRRLEKLKYQFSIRKR